MLQSETLAASLAQPDSKTDDILASANAKIKFRVSKASPYRGTCIQCAKAYEACWQKEEDVKRYLGDPCVGKWQGCVLDKKASCTIWEAE